MIKLNKVITKIKRFFNEKVLIASLIIAKGCVGIPVQAGLANTGVPELDNMMNKLIMILGGLVTLYGVVKLINGVKAWSDANEEMDAARKSQGMQTIISGIICVLVLPILGVLGYAL